MTLTTGPSYTAFDGHRRIASGPLERVALELKRRLESGAAGPVLLFDDASGQPFDIDTRGSEQQVLARLAKTSALAGSGETATRKRTPRGAPVEAERAEAEPENTEPRGRGRPKLGVVAREVTLLPRHWEWLAAQPRGASVTLRQLVDEARKAHAALDERRAARDRAYYFMSAIAGDLPGFEEAARALFADDPRRMRELIREWPEDVRDHAIQLAFGDGSID